MDASKTGYAYAAHGGGMSRYAPHAFGGLEVAMKRWLALRAEGLYALHTKETFPERRHTAVSLSGVPGATPNRSSTIHRNSLLDQ